MWFWYDDDDAFDLNIMFNVSESADEYGSELLFVMVVVIVIGTIIGKSSLNEFVWL